MDKLNIKGYHYNPDVDNKVGAYFYDSDECEDDYIQITPDPNNDDILTIIYVRSCEQVRIEAYSKRDCGGDLEFWIKRTLAGL